MSIINNGMPQGGQGFGMDIKGFFSPRRHLGGEKGKGPSLRS